MPGVCSMRMTATSALPTGDGDGAGVVLAPGVADALGVAD
jgi:hypothetical protein